MAKRTTATNWEIITRDESGAMVNIDYICPHCGYATGELISIGVSSNFNLDNGWETDQVCVICNKEVTIECR